MRYHSRYVLLLFAMFILGGNALHAEPRANVYTEDFSVGELHEWTEPMAGALFLGVAMVTEVREVIIKRGGCEEAFITWVISYRTQGTNRLVEKYPYAPGYKRLADYLVDEVVRGMSPEDRAEYERWMR